jgi:PASTA domain
MRDRVQGIDTVHTGGPAPSATAQRPDRRSRRLAANIHHKEGQPIGGAAACSPRNGAATTSHFRYPKEGKMFTEPVSRCLRILVITAALVGALAGPAAAGQPASATGRGAVAPAAAQPVSSPRSDSVVTMPYVVGLKLAAAQTQVALAGLSPYVRYLDNDCTINRVASQEPGAGTQLPAGTQVYLYVHPICNGPQP